MRRSLAIVVLIALAPPLMTLLAEWSIQRDERDERGEQSSRRDQLDQLGRLGRLNQDQLAERDQLVERDQLDQWYRQQARQEVQQWLQNRPVDSVDVTDSVFCGALHGFTVGLVDVVAQRLERKDTFESFDWKRTRCPGAGLLGTVLGFGVLMYMLHRELRRPRQNRPSSLVPKWDGTRTIIADLYTTGHVFPVARMMGPRHRAWRPR